MKDYAGNKRSDYYQQAMKVLTAHFGDRRLLEVTRSDVYQFAAKRGESVGPSTLRKNLTALGTMFRMAIEWELVEIDPTARLKKPGEPQHKILYLAEREFQDLLHAAPPWIRQMYRLTIAQGLRLKEVTGTRWQDVDLKSGRMYVNPDNKTERPDAIRLTAEARAVLEEREATRKAFAKATGRLLPWVFFDEEGKGYNDEKDRNIMTKLTVALMKAIGRPGCSFHTFRHTTASWLVQRGVDLARVREFMRHQNIQTTLRYAHLRPEHMNDVVDALDSAFSDGHFLDTSSGEASTETANLLKRKERL
jgi:site-specific recombinase XerD